MKETLKIIWLALELAPLLAIIDIIKTQKPGDSSFHTFLQIGIWLGVLLIFVELEHVWQKRAEIIGTFKSALSYLPRLGSAYRFFKISLVAGPAFGFARHAGNKTIRQMLEELAVVLAGCLIYF